MLDFCEIKSCRQVSAYKYYGKLICGHHWSKHCDSSKFDLKKADYKTGKIVATSREAPIHMIIAELPERCIDKSRMDVLSQESSCPLCDAGVPLKLTGVESGRSSSTVPNIREVIVERRRRQTAMLHIKNI